jgi:hypothetical protein
MLKRIKELFGRLRSMLDHNPDRAEYTKIEQAFRESELKYKMIAEHTSDLIGIPRRSAAIAMESMPDGGTIHVSVTSSPTHVTVTIKDEGVGMDPSSLASLVRAQPYKLYCPNRQLFPDKLYQFVVAFITLFPKQSVTAVFKRHKFRVFYPFFLC